MCSFVPLDELQFIVSVFAGNLPLRLINYRQRKYFVSANNPPGYTTLPGFE